MIGVARSSANPSSKVNTLSIGVVDPASCGLGLQECSPESRDKDRRRGRDSSLCSHYFLSALAPNHGERVQ